MKKYLLPESGNFYKANMHCHTTLSDGRLTPEEVKEAYKAQGYSIVAFTDHDILIPHPELRDEDFLPLNGFEVEINDKVVDWDLTKTCHICFVAKDPDNVTQPCYNPAYLFGNAPQYKHLVKYDENEPPYWKKRTHEGVSEIMQICRDKGFFVTYNHPVWSLEYHDDYIGYNGMHAMEMFNYSCIASGHDDYNPTVYEEFLRSGRKLYVVGGDDNHNAYPFGSPRCDSFGGFTVIKADKLDYKTVTDALEAGNFYASMGPEIYDLWYEDGEVHVTCSDAVKITLDTFSRSKRVAYGEKMGDIINEATFKLYDKEVYFRLTVTDATGKHACTNAYFLEDILK